MAQLNFAGTLTAAVLSKGTASFQSAFEGATNAARELSNQVQFTAKQVQEGFFTAAIAGYDLERSILLAGTAMKLATIGSVDFKSAVNDTIAVMKAFSFEMAELPEIAAAMTAAFTHSKMTLQDFFTSMRYVAPIAVAAFGQTAETFIDTAAALMVMQDVGLQASKAGVYLRGTIQKLMGATSKANRVFAEYGANLFEVGAVNQEYFKTITQGRQVLTEYEKRINALKSKQLQLALAGQTASPAFEKITKAIAKTSGEMAILKKGMSEVETQFSLAGGTLKPIKDVLTEIATKVPTEVIARAFGIRGGTGIVTLLNNVEQFYKKREIVKSYYEEAQRGNSLLEAMFIKVIDNILIEWQRLKNVVTNIFSIIFDEIFKEAAPLLKVFTDGFNEIFKTVGENRGVFRAIAEELGKALKPIAENFMNLLKEGMKGLSSLTSEDKSFTVPIFGKNEQGAISKIGEQEVTGTIFDKLAALIRAFSTLFTIAFKDAISSLAPLMSPIGEAVGFGLIDLLNRNLAVFTKIGGAIGKGMLGGIASSPLLKGLAGVSGMGASALQIAQEEGVNMKPLASLFKEKGTMTAISTLIKMVTNEKAGFSAFLRGEFNKSTLSATD